MKRRSFFRSLARAAAIVALAPQIAFRVRPEIPVVQPFRDLTQIMLDHVKWRSQPHTAFWLRTTWDSYLQDEEYKMAYLKALGKLPEHYKA